MKTRAILWLWCWSAFLYGQSHLPRALKCAPGLQVGEKREYFTLTVGDVHAFERRLALEAPQARVLSRYEPAGVIALYCPPETFWRRVAVLPEVLVVDRGHAEAWEERAVPGHDLSLNHIYAVHRQYPDLDGRGVVVSVKEWRFDSADVDLRGRVLLTGRSAPKATDHATFMATLIAGAGTSAPQARGVARGAQVLSSSFVGLLPDADEDYKTWQVAIQNHSYGSNIENYYSPGALAYDMTTMEHPELLHVFSAGNLGYETPTVGGYAGVQGWANLTGSYKMAKNVLLVGVMDRDGFPDYLGSAGPAHDGRLKPDLVAYGPNGTSEAAALVSGAAAVVRQCLQEQRQMQPTSDLLRAILLAACDEVDKPGPDYRSGHGNLNLRRAIEVARQQPLWQGALAHGQRVEHIFNVPAGTHRLRAVLCWNDPPAIPLAPKALVNDLDLTLIAPDGQVWHPWVLSTFAKADSLSQPARRGIDTLNNTEAIDVYAPAPGAYTLRVSARAISSGKQRFAIAVCTEAAGRLEWKSPSTGEQAISGEALRPRWQHSYPADTRGVLQWRALPDGPWTTLKDSLLLRRGGWVWVLPTTTTVAQVRMVVGNDHWLSDTILIAPLLRLKVDVHCSDSTLLRWNAAHPNARYRLWGLGSHYMEPLPLLIPDTSIVLYKDRFPQTHFAVSALFNGAETLPSPAPAIAEQGAGCYLNAFLALLERERQRVALQLHLSSLYGVEEVFWEKWRAGSWQLLRREAPLSLRMEAEDYEISQGTNTYRVRLRMANGATPTTAPVHVYYTGPAPALVYPNPARATQALTLLLASEHLPAQWRLYDPLGRLLVEKPVEDAHATWLLPYLSPGLYTWVFTRESQVLARGFLKVKP
ncbi:MAG: S8 family peptidase [Saprospiraceae bacterium]|nr:S8 family peptidase [Saprospiraceae bacterium]MDW8228273.1 S8 family peptidase [Saprospiraceae bacterium]